VRRRAGAKAAGPSHPRGFTLIELLVVLAILVVAMVAMPRLIAGLPGVRLRAAADEMAAALRNLHEAAIVAGDTTEMILDPKARTYRVSTEAGSHPLPQVVDEIRFRPVAPVSTGPDDARIIRFYGDGSANGGAIRLGHGDLSASISVDWLTGRVSTHE
jgi:type II secretion system protein H